MNFELWLSLDNAEGTEDPHRATCDYLCKVATLVVDGRTEGPVIDGNGNTIGEFRFTDDA